MINSNVKCPYCKSYMVEGYESDYDLEEAQLICPSCRARGPKDKKPGHEYQVRNLSIRLDLREEKNLKVS